MTHTHVIKTIRRIVQDLAHPNVTEDEIEQLNEIPGKRIINQKLYLYFFFKHNLCQMKHTIEIIEIKLRYIF